MKRFLAQRRRGAEGGRVIILGKFELRWWLRQLVG